ncbi:MAG: hypothetical protein NTY04_00530 [Candidatus Staskawiczbacteria bacterium]|nr:hypothetical protein [Candidatus Staskawiczbacteria bacterium]
MKTKIFFALLLPLAIITGFVLAVPIFAQQLNANFSAASTNSINIRLQPANNLNNTGTQAPINLNGTTVQAPVSIKSISGQAGSNINIPQSQNINSIVSPTIKPNAVTSTGAKGITGNTSSASKPTLKNKSSANTKTFLSAGSVNASIKLSGTGGTVVSVAGTTITMSRKTTATGKDTTIYKVDASKAKITKNKITASVSDIKVGDIIIVQGKTSGTNIVASRIIDQKIPPTGKAGSSAKSAISNGSSSNSTSQKASTGFFGGVSNFFKHLFGF